MNIKVGQILNRYPGNTRYKASNKLIDILKRLKRSKSVFPAENIISMYFFPQHGLKNPRILYAFLVLKFLGA